MDRETKKTVFGEVRGHRVCQKNCGLGLVRGISERDITALDWPYRLCRRFPGRLTSSKLMISLGPVT